MSSSFSVRRLPSALALVGASFLAGCGSAGSDPLGSQEGEIKVCAAGATVKGIDVSSWQGNVGWTSVKADGIDFAIARVSDGSYMDSKFDQNWSGMKAAGIVRGAYQFFEPAQDPAAQADIMIQKLGVLAAEDLPCTLDVEVDGGQTPATIVAHIQTWVDAVTAGTGKKPMIYTGPGFWNGSVASTAFGSLPMWAANWGVTCPNLADGWTDWKVWQYSSTGSVAGISGAVDLDEFNGTLADLASFAGGAALPTWGAKYVSQSFPLASQALVMTAGESVASYLELKNVGTATWDSSTRLATTQPRDRASAFQAPDWIGPGRPSAVSGTVPPGGTYKFAFTLHAPSTPGTYFEFFGVVEDGTAWFSDPGQLGPPDDQLEAQIQVVASEGGTGGSGGGAPDAGADGKAGSGGVYPWPEAGTGGASGEPGSNAAPLATTADAGGCGCRAPGTRAGTRGYAVALLAATCALAASRRRRAAGVTRT